MRGYYAILAICLLCAGVVQAKNQGTPVTPTVETVHTEDGTYFLWHQSPATAADLEIPLMQGKVQESFAYRVRDRKQRDILRYARVSFTIAQSPAEVINFYHTSLGKQAVVNTAQKSGEVTLTTGTQDNLRLVTATPQAHGCLVQLERVQRFTIPPRSYTAQEHQVLRVLESVAQHYRMARHVAYTVEQHSTTNKSHTMTETQSWVVDFHRPDGLQISVTTGAKTVLTISAQEHRLVVTATGAKEQRRTFGAKITPELLPELRDDPVARLMLGDALVTASVDYLTLSRVAGAPPEQQAEVILTYPDRNATLFLYLDLRQKTILRSEMLTPQEDGRQRIVRTYRHMQVD